MTTWDDPVPCRRDPEAWFGYDGECGRKRRRLNVQAIERAKLLCVRECPADQRRRCARGALDRGEVDGIWAGVELILHKTTAQEQQGKLAAAYRQLEAIAGGADRVAPST